MNEFQFTQQEKADLYTYVNNLERDIKEQFKDLRTVVGITLKVNRLGYPNARFDIEVDMTVYPGVDAVEYRYSGITYRIDPDTQIDFDNRKLTAEYGVILWAIYKNAHFIYNALSNALHESDSVTRELRELSARSKTTESTTNGDV